jgi:flagellar hook-basal body complex protein FliE
MTTVPTILVTPSSAAEAYNRIAGTSGADGAGGSFGAAVQQALAQAEQTGKAADSQAMKAISGSGNLTDVVTALSRAEMTLQTVTAIRDRVVQAYQDIMKMPI